MPPKNEVDVWFAKHGNPMEPVAQRFCEILLAAGLLSEDRKCGGCECGKEGT